MQFFANCNKNSPLWKVFRGCGHSFHIACTLPDLSVCDICESTLHKKLEVLGHKANKAVFTNIDSIADNQDNDTSDDDPNDDADDNDDDMYKGQPENDANHRITPLLEQISHWKL